MTTTPTKKQLTAYLKARVSAEQDAPHQGLPFISDTGVLRVRPADWCDWLAEQGAEASKREALQTLKNAGLVQRVYQLPGEKKSFGLYTGPAPTGTGKLPRRASRASAD